MAKRRSSKKENNCKRVPVLTADASREELRMALEQIGYKLKKEDFEPVYDLLTHIDAREKLSVIELMERFKEQSSKTGLPYEIVSCSIKIELNNGVRNVLAFVRLRKDGLPIESTYVRSQIGEIDAGIRAVQQTLDVSAQITEMHVHTIGVGSGAEVSAHLVLEGNDGGVQHASAVNGSTIMAVLRAYIKGLNAIKGLVEERLDVLPNPFQFRG